MLKIVFTQFKLEFTNHFNLPFTKIDDEMKRSKIEIWNMQIMVD